jgi:uncharacterized protein with PIN domain
VRETTLEVRIAAELRMFLAARRRGASVTVSYDGTSSLGHVVESLGVPLPEVGRMVIGGRVREPGYRPEGGAVIEVAAVSRPQPLPSARFALDVHLGTLARRLRLLGVDSCYAGDLSGDPDDDALIERANRDGRLLLTQDRDLLRRRALRRGAYVRGTRPEEQLLDVLDRFAPRLAPWTRCTACNGLLSSVPKSDIAHRLRPGTRRSYEVFSRCPACGRIYWRGAHSRRLQEIVDRAVATTTAISSRRRSDAV